MRVLEINAIYGTQSTGTIVKNIQSTCFNNNIECYVAYSECYLPSSQVRDGYKIGNIFDYKLHALFTRIAGKMGYYSHIPTYFFLRYLDKIKPDIVHLHNLHGNFINLPMLLKYVAKKDIATVITMHDCWYFTGGCTHYSSSNCNRWQQSCCSCPRRYEEVPAYLYDGSAKILSDRVSLLSAIPRLTMIGCSKWISEECKKSKIRCSNVSYIHNGFNTDIFKPLNGKDEIVAFKKKYDIPLDNKIILCPASKWYESRNSTTFSYFVDNLPDNITMVVFGCSVPGGGGSPKVKELGYFKTPSDMAALYSCGDVMVNCSREDTLSSLNIECQACGTPVVAYDNTGTSETVHPNIGRLVETGNAEMLLKETLDTLSSNLMHNKDVLVEWATTNFEKQANFNKYIELFRTIYNK